MIALKHLQEKLNQITKAAAKEAVDEAREGRDTIDGVDVCLRYEGERGRSSITVYSGVFLDDERYGIEVEHLPWSVFQSIRKWYNVGGPHRLEEAKELIVRAAVKDAEAVEEPYGPVSGPVLYYFEVGSLESVVALFKAYKSNTKKTR